MIEQGPRSIFEIGWGGWGGVRGAKFRLEPAKWASQSSWCVCVCVCVWGGGGGGAKPS